jgi:hypothetical protein
LDVSIEPKETTKTNQKKEIGLSIAGTESYAVTTQVPSPQQCLIPGLTSQDAKPRALPEVQPPFI